MVQQQVRSCAAAVQQEDANLKPLSACDHAKIKKIASHDCVKMQKTFCGNFAEHRFARILHFVLMCSRFEFVDCVLPTLHEPQPGDRRGASQHPPLAFWIQAKCICHAPHQSTSPFVRAAKMQLSRDDIFTALHTVPASFDQPKGCSWAASGHSNGHR